MEQGYQGAARRVREFGSGLPIRTVGFLTILTLSQFAVLITQSDREGFNSWSALLYILMPVAFFTYALAGKVRLEELRLLGVLVFAILAFLISWGLTLALFGIVWEFTFPEVAASAMVGTIIMQVLFVAPSEELVFRFVLPQYFLGKFKASYAWFALLIPQISFGLYHWAAYRGDWVSIAVAVVFGIVMMAAYYVRINPNWGLGNKLGLGFCIGAHAAYNLVIYGVLSGGIVMIGGG
jgi:hypothetical protein